MQFESESGVVVVGAKDLRCRVGFALGGFGHAFGVELGIGCRDGRALFADLVDDRFADFRPVGRVERSEGSEAVCSARGFRDGAELVGGFGGSLRAFGCPFDRAGK